jgi:hypothetical protein
MHFIISMSKRVGVRRIASIAGGLELHGYCDYLRRGEACIGGWLGLARHNLHWSRNAHCPLILTHPRLYSCGPFSARPEIKELVADSLAGIS